jgi:hypothetical protein
MNHSVKGSLSPALSEGSAHGQAGTGFKAGWTGIAQLTQNRRNVRRRTPRSREMLRESLSTFGAARSVVVDENGEILCGNGTVEACAQLGITQVLVIPADGQTLVAVQRSDLDSAQKAGLMLADNRTSDTSEDDGKALLRLLDEEKQLDISSWYTEEEVEALSREIEEDDADPGKKSGNGQGATTLEVRLTFEDESEFQRFNALLSDLAAALPEAEDVATRLGIVIDQFLRRAKSETQKTAKGSKP